MSELHLDPARWARIEALPLPKGLGNLEHGLSAAARIAYYATGEVTDRLDCVSQVALGYLIGLQDKLPRDLRQSLGSVEYRDALLATTPEDDARLVWVVAQSARQAALRALAYVGLGGMPETLALRACSPIVDSATTVCARSAALAATKAAYDRADAAADAAANAYAYAAAYAQAAAYAAYLAADAAAAKAAAYVAFFADTCYSAAAVEWRHAITTLRTLLRLPT